MTLIENLPSHESFQMIECVPPQAEKLYRRFFTASIVVILTAGATWGGWLLWQIGAAQKFTAISIHAVNAHGQAQIYGWVGLFIMGFAYQVLPRFWRGPLAGPGLGMPVLILMVAGIFLRTFGMAAENTSWAIPVSLAGSLCQVVSISIFAVQMALTCRAGKTAFTPNSAFILAALGWYILMSLVDTWHTYTTMSAPTREKLLWYIATYQAPLRDLQIHGLALFMILGVSSQMIPAFFTRPAASNRRAWWALGILLTAVISEVVIFVVYRWLNMHFIAAFLLVSWVLLAVGVVMVVWPWRLWEAPKRPHRSDKFIRIAYLWLAISLGMLLMLPVYQALSGIKFSHAYYGAIRHAVTVGFVSMMIMGMSSRFVPAIRGIPFGALSRLYGPFILVNLGCFLRVSLQGASDLVPAFFSVVAISAVFEVSGLLWWSSDLMRTMWSNPARMQVAAQSA